MAFKLSLTSWSLPACSLQEAAGISKVLGINALDVGYFYGPALDKAKLLAEPERVADEVTALGIDLPCLYHLFGSTLADRNLADPRHLEANVADLKQAVRFCKRAGIGVIFVLPGVVNPGQGRREALAQSAASLKRLLPIAAEAGITLTVEPHVHSYLEIAGADARADRKGARAEARARLWAFRLPRLSPGGDRRARAACRPCASAAGEDGRTADEAREGHDQHSGAACRR